MQELNTRTQKWQGEKMVQLSLMITLLLLLTTPQTTADVGGVPAMYVFGDSSVDVGNNNYLPLTKFKCNFPLYGVDFPGGVPTGRYSNGFNFVDFLAMRLGFDRSPPPSLSVQNGTANVINGVNFASGGCGILDVFDNSLCLSMNTQITQFKETTRSLDEFTRKKKNHDRFIHKSLFIINTGNNDIFNYFYSNHTSDNTTQTKEFMSLLVTTFNHQLQELYDLGARKILVVGIGNIGCVPSARTRTTTGDCNHELNHLIYKSFNKVIKEEILPQLSSRNRNLEYSFLDEYLASTAVMSKSYHYGFVEMMRACCGGGRLNGELPCRPNATMCDDHERYIFWDGNHQTQAFSGLMARFAYDGGLPVVTPVNVRKLVGY